MSTTHETRDLLKRVMRDHGYANVQELSTDSGVPYNTVYRWSKGESNPHRRTIAAFLQALNIDPMLAACGGEESTADDISATFAAIELQLSSAQLAGESDVLSSAEVDMIGLLAEKQPCVEFDGRTVREAAQDVAKQLEDVGDDGEARSIRDALRDADKCG